MRNLHKFLWIIALGALIMASASCKSADDEEEVKKGPYTTIDPRVLGKWYGNSAPNANSTNPGTPVYEFKADGTFTLKSGTTGTFTATNGKLTGRSSSNPNKDQVLTYVIDDTAKSIVFTNVEGPTVIPSGKNFKHFDADIVGKWYADKGTTTQIFEFKTDGTFIVTDGKTDYYYEYGATFSAAGGKLTMIIPGDKDETSATYTINADKKELTITNPATGSTGWGKVSTTDTYYKK